MATMAPVVILLLVFVCQQALGSAGAFLPKASDASVRIPLYLRAKRSAVIERQKNDTDDDGFQTTDRRQFVASTFTAVVAITTSSVVFPTLAANAAVQTAVGSAERECRERGDCLERGEWDGAVGWNWGARDRCDPNDPQCGSDGLLRELPDLPVPAAVEGMTHEVQISLAIGKNSEERGTVRFGLFGKVCPGSVQQLVAFLDTAGGGLVTAAEKDANSWDEVLQVTDALKLAVGGTMTNVWSDSRVAFGIPSQTTAYARSRRLIKAPAEFVPQPRPSSTVRSVLAKEPGVRQHEIPGLVSLSKEGLGASGNDDTAFTSALQFTTSAVPSMDKDRRVVGQVLDAESMKILARLSRIPHRKGLAGALPGQDNGPPLVRVTVADCQVKSII